jgi:uncharacterized protein YkwD
LRDLPHLLRSVVPAILAVAIILPVPGFAVAGADHRTVVATDKMRAAEARLLKDINRIRARNGRKPLRLDKPTSRVARARSSDMAAKRYFAHVEPDGDNADRILGRRDISATEVTENIGHTIGLTLKQGKSRMANWWYRSPPHRRQMLARDINYVGIGIARRGGRFTYTAIFTRSRDKTSPRVVIDETTWLPNDDGWKVSIEWHGVDPELATGTAGIKRYEVERFAVVGGWSDVHQDPGKPKLSFRALGSNSEHLRIRAVDKAGNVGPWAFTRVDIRRGPPSPA